MTSTTELKPDILLNLLIGDEPYRPTHVTLSSGNSYSIDEPGFPSMCGGNVFTLAPAEGILHSLSCGYAAPSVESVVGGFYEYVGKGINLFSIISKPEDVEWFSEFFSILDKELTEDNYFTHAHTSIALDDGNTQMVYILHHVNQPAHDQYYEESTDWCSDCDEPLSEGTCDFCGHDYSAGDEEGRARNLAQKDYSELRYSKAVYAPSKQLNYSHVYEQYTSAAYFRCVGPPAPVHQLGKSLYKTLGYPFMTWGTRLVLLSSNIAEPMYVTVEAMALFLSKRKELEEWGVTILKPSDVATNRNEGHHYIDSMALIVSDTARFNAFISYCKENQYAEYVPSSEY